MALSEENGGSGLNVSMPVAPVGYGAGYGYGYPVMPYVPYAGGYNNNGFGGDWSFLLILFLFAMMGGGFGGNGFGGGNNMFPWLMTGQAGINANTNAGFDNAALASQLSGINSGIASGFGDTALGIAGINQNICAAGGNITAAVTGAQNSVSQQLYNNEIASLNRSFAEQTANTNAINGVQSKLADCCCENRLATQQLGTTIAQDGSATRQAIAQGIQSIQDKLCQLELDGVKSDLASAQRENATLQNQLNMAAFKADNTAQTVALERSQADQTQYIVNRVAPYPIPSYIVGSPYGYGYGFNYGYNPQFNPFGNVGFGNGSF